MRMLVPLIALLAVGAGTGPDGSTPAGGLGLKVVFQDDFESGDLGKQENGYRWAQAQGHPGTLPEVSTEIAHSGTHSLKFTFRGTPDPAADAWSEQRFAFGERLTEVYLEWRQYFPTGEDGHGARFVHRRPRGPDNNKFLRLWDEDYNRFNVKVGFSTVGRGGGPDSRMIAEAGIAGAGVGPRPGMRQWNDAITDATRGQWLQFRVHVKLASFSNDDGVIEMWVNGEKVVEGYGLRMLPRDPSGNYLRHGYLMGWANSGFAETTHTYIDDFAVMVPEP